ncbi:fhu operon transcriptional regulator [Clostridium tetanomorphum DSM 665]|nr:LysR family transcriptional regulator [Clostridium tetanomorphum]KAJ49621.1 fhu operon transcriptional regulator [Clostridium tetanomorphum DSM 665]KAJ52446.1 fhu operon transcriptional regulator [Clostridium tetanomorphum DSM 665]NRZ97111.1 DNA-binding transcriptional LysR family regulator [Clostridium tetanomorphum]
MNLLSMKYFLAVYKERNFTKAAQHLYITQQTLSAHIASLEKELGCKLFIRSTPLKPTFAGDIFLRYANEFNTLYTSIEEEFLDICDEKKGLLRIGIAHTRGRVLMPDIIAEYKKDHSDITIQIIEGENDDLPSFLINGTIDLMIANYSQNHPDIKFDNYYEEEVILLISDKLLENTYGKRKNEIVNMLHQTLNLSLLKECPFLLSSKDDIAGRISSIFLSEVNFDLKVAVEAKNIETLLEMCCKGIGVCFCPKILVHKTLDNKQISALHLFQLDERAKYMISFGFIKKPYYSKAVREFVEVAKVYKSKDVF